MVKGSGRRDISSCHDVQESENWGGSYLLPGLALVTLLPTTHLTLLNSPVEESTSECSFVFHTHENLGDVLDITIAVCISAVSYHLTLLEMQTLELHSNVTESESGFSTRSLCDLYACSCLRRIILGYRPEPTHLLMIVSSL